MSGDDDTDTATLLHPAWRQGLEEFITAAHPPGTILTHAYFYALLRLPRPTADTPHGKAEKMKLAFMQQFTSLRTALLLDHQIDLESKFAHGYRVVPAQEQTKLAMTDHSADLIAILRKALLRVTNVDLTALDDRQRAENADALTRISQIRSFVRTRLR